MLKPNPQTLSFMATFILFFSTISQELQAQSKDQLCMEWFLEEYESARLPKESDFGTREIWDSNSVKILHYSNETITPENRYFVIDPSAGELHSPRLVFGKFILRGATYNPRTDTHTKQNRTVPVIFGEVNRATESADPVVFSPSEKAAVMTYRDGKSVIAVRVKGKGKDLKLFAIEREYSQDGSLFTETYSYMNKIIYKKHLDGREWMHPAHEVEFSMQPQPK